MEIAVVKIKLAVFWLFVAVTNSAIGTITLMAPGVIDNIRAGHIFDTQIGPELLLLVAILYYWIPLVMAVLSIMLKDSINRWVNIVAGIVYVVFVLNELISNITTIAYLFGMLMEVSTVVIIALIIWHAWQWSKE